MSDAALISQPWPARANLGWLFDEFELYALFLTVGPAMHSLLDPAQYPQIPAYIGTVVAITLLAWAIGCSESQW